VKLSAGKNIKKVMGEGDTRSNCGTYQLRNRANSKEQRAKGE
jgi:hypothetical protein